ncbi:MAG: hypothetical protein GTN89_00395 [Acidobacteria bacterium]|nr:hypothetical protein [Acidobacteriota bacterium]NIM60180.1 hypothetical protein [Acidobacteriota bacterium]NIO57849.1 hypothetical protein [Acidobacteriota bacterium]NIQ28858.1 hypothetical protein [Acidobacteriota bacterium]NIQ83316.1 hypothetical protein [Acidobacteriota bacterium]
MSKRHDAHSERAHALMMAALDGELTAQDHDELERMLSGDADLSAEFERLKNVKEVTTTMTFREPPEEVWETYWEKVYNRSERAVAWTLISAGLAILYGWGCWHAVHSILANTGIPWFIKFAIFAAATGGGILFISVAREKWFTRKRDTYKGVLR